MAKSITNGGELLKSFENFYWSGAFFLLAVLLLSGCISTPRPKNAENVCAIFKEYPSWYKDTQKTARKWGIPAAVQMSILYQESSFDAEARPPRTKLLWIIPWKHITSAYGYSQALDSTWDEYKKSTHRYFVKRNSFADASDFVGWYSEQAHRHAGIAKNDAYRLYLAYHEGWTGYSRQSYRAKPWLMAVARKVQYRAVTYQRQLNGCKADLEKQKKWYQF